jgi:hypothetical protein
LVVFFAFIVDIRSVMGVLVVSVTVAMGACQCEG